MNNDTDPLYPIAKKIRKKPEPILIEFETFRMRGHEEAPGTKYVPKKLTDEWATKDPIENYENSLLESKLIDEDFIADEKAAIKKEIVSELDIAYNSAALPIDIEKEKNDIYAAASMPASGEQAQWWHCPAPRPGIARLTGLPAGVR